MSNSPVVQPSMPPSSAPAPAAPGSAAPGSAAPLTDGHPIRAPRQAAQATERLRVLMVEDDPGDAFLVSELLSEVDAPIDLRTAGTLREALTQLDGVQCVLLDLDLPDAHGLEALRRLLDLDSGAAVCVLTGLEDEHLGVAAVGEGAHDYLVKGQVDGVLLARSVRYAVERKRADINVRRLREAELLQAESARLERGLLPQPLMSTKAVAVTPFYRPGRRRALLGGDFYDVIQTAPHELHLLIGDVCGHDVDEAALGAQLRVAWRALVLAGVQDDAVIAAVEQVLVSERRAEEIFATLAVAHLDLAAGEVTVRLAGHPPPLLISNGTVRRCDVQPGMVLGVIPGRSCPVGRFELGADDWTLLMYTDGLIEGFANGANRLGIGGLEKIITEHPPAPIGLLPEYLVQQAEQSNGGPLPDDVAMLLLTRERS